MVVKVILRISFAPEFTISFQVLARNLKLIRSLQNKKYRLQHGLFIVEGVKNVDSLLYSTLKIHSLYHLEHWKLPALNDWRTTEMHMVNKEWMDKASCLDSSSPVLAVAYIPETKTEHLPLNNKLIPVLAGINDPGNLGTIIRLCDWFGIPDIIISENTADVYNPKTVQSTMGSLFNVNVYRTDLELFLKNNKHIYGLPVIAADMKGKKPDEYHLIGPSIILFGSESHGIPANLKPFIHELIHIPGSGKSFAESLNVALAAAILLHHFSK